MAILNQIDASAARPSYPWGTRIFICLKRLPPVRRAGRSVRFKTAAAASGWTMLGYGASQTLRLASTLILARMLAPSAFGLVALVNVFLSGLEMLSDLGIGMDVVQHPSGDDPRFLDTALLIQLVRSTVLWIIATALAYPFARFYNQPQVLSLLVAGSLSVLLRGFVGSSIWTLTRHLRLRTYNVLTALTDLVGFLAALVWALVSPSAWALVAGRVVSVLALVIGSHVIAERPLALAWDSTYGRDILRFGSGIFLSTATYFLAGESERLVIGKFASLKDLGCFSIALSVAWAGTKGLQQVVTQVFFPMISASVRDNHALAAVHYDRSRYVILAVSCCASVGFTLCSHLFVRLSLGPKYAGAGWMLQLMGIRGAIELYMSVTVSMLFAMGKTRYAAIGNVCKLAFMAVGLSIALKNSDLRFALRILTLAPIANYIPLLSGLKTHCRGSLRAEYLGCLTFAAISGAAFLVQAGGS